MVCVAETIVLDPAAAATSRTALDITAWIDADGPDWGDATITQYLAEAARGSLPVDFTIPNRTVTIPLNIHAAGATSFDTFRQQIQAKAALIQREGGWLSRQTSIGTLYMDVVNATLKLGGGTLQAVSSIDPDAVLTLECTPDFYGAEITLDDIVETSAAEIVTKLKLSAADAVIKGDYPGRVRIVVDEDQAQAQLGLIWGLRCRQYSSATTAALRYEAEALTPMDTAAIATVTGASGGASNNVVRHANLATTWTPVLSTTILSGTASMTHTGTYRVWARVYSTSAVPPQLRFAWDVGDLTNPITNARWTIPVASNFYAADLGEIRLDAPPAGTHRWQGVIQAQGDAGGENVSIDKVWFQPVDEFAGVLRAPITVDPGIAGYSARDEFNQAAGALTGKTAAVGGVWAGAGDADDFAINTTDLTAQRTATSDADTQTGRYAISGVTGFAAQVVQVDATRSVIGGTGYSGVLARYTDVNNWFRAMITWPVATDSGASLVVTKRVAGTVTHLVNTTVQGFKPAADEWFTIRLYVDAAGRWSVRIFRPGTSRSLGFYAGSDSVLATAGTLATGKPGFFDYNNATACTRDYDNFAAWAQPPDAVLHASQSAELRHDGMFREDSTGVAYGPVSHVTGDLPRLPPSGLENRPVELFLKASRGDLDELSDSGIDDVSARAFYRPSWLHIPGT